MLASSEIEWEPLYLSTIAGLSTCIGAAVVFCQPQNERDNSRIVPPDTMAFSLALAGAVMVTVSVVSILPEVLMDDEGEAGEYSTYKMIHILSWTMFYRVFFYGLGSGLYFCLSSLLNVPEPEEMIDDVLFLSENVSSNSERNSNNNYDLEAEMVELMSNDAPSTTPTKNTTNTTTTMEMKSHGIHENVEESPLRERRNQNHPGLEVPPSPGDDNGKAKIKGGNSSSERITLSAWTTGEDLVSDDKKKAWRVAILLFISLLVHNFPEGLAVAASVLESAKLGMFYIHYFYY